MRLITSKSEIKIRKRKRKKNRNQDFDNIDATKVAAANVKFYVDADEGFIGTSLKRRIFV